MAWPPTTHQDVQDAVTGLRNLTNVPKTWMAIGDSITEGSYASTRENRWISRARDKLRTRAGLTGGVGYIPAWQVTVADGGGFLWPNPWTPTGDASLIDWLDSLGFRGALLNAGASMSISVTGTSVDVWAIRAPGNAALSIKIDGGTPVTLATDGAYGSPTVRTGISLGTRGTHTVAISSPTGTAALAGVMVYDGDETAGLRLYDAAHSGWNSTQAINFNPGNLAALVAQAAPDLVSIGIGVNDIAAGIASTTTAANVAQLAQTVWAGAPRARIIFVLTYAPAGNDAAWGPYTNELRYLCATRNLELLDLRDRMGVATTSGYWHGDGLHPSDTGHELIADLFVDCVTR